MIKTYKARVNRNNVSYLLYGKQGNEVRYNFTNGNVVTNKYPSLTLRGRYYQELLEDSLLFRGETIIIDHEQEEYTGEKAALEAEKNGSNNSKETSSTEDITEKTTEASTKQVKTEEVRGIRTSAEVIAYVNERYDKECKTLATAMKHASKDGLVFPDFNE